MEKITLGLEIFPKSDAWYFQQYPGLHFIHFDYYLYFTEKIAFLHRNYRKSFVFNIQNFRGKY